MRYEEPRIEIMEFEKNDIITTSKLIESGTGTGSGLGEGGSFGDFGN